MLRIIHERFDHLFPLLYIFFFALTISVLFLSSQEIGDLGVESDFYSELVVSAQKLWQGDFSAENYPFKGPVYSFALVAIHSFGGDWYANAIALNLICASLSLFVIYRLFVRIYNRPVAVSAIILLSLYFEFFYHAHKASSDMLFFLLIFLSINLLVRRRWAWYHLCMAGFTIGLAFLTRYNGIFLLAAAPFMLIFIDPGNWPRSRRYLAVMIVVGAFLVPCIPWFWINFSETGSILSTRNLYNVVQEFYGGARKENIPPGGFSSIYHLIAHDPGYFLWHFGKNVFQHLLLDIRLTIGPFMGSLVILGMLRLLVIPTSRDQKSFLIFPLFYYLSMCAVFHIPRLSLPILPAYLATGLSLLFGSGSTDRSGLGNWLENRFSRPLQWINRPTRISPWLIISILTVCGLFAWELVQVVSAERYYRRLMPRYILEAARVLKSRKEPGSTPVIMARKAHLAYYSGMRYQNYPIESPSYSVLLDYAIDHQVKYIAYGDIERLHIKADAFMQNLHTNAGIDLYYRDGHTMIFSIADWRNNSRITSDMNDEALLRIMDDAERSEDPDRIIYVCMGIADLHIADDDLTKAGDCYLRGMKSIRALQENSITRTALADLRNHLSLIYLKLERHRDGIELQEKNISFLTETGNRTGLAQSHLLISRHFEMLNEFDAARSHLQAAHDLYIILGNQNAAQRTSRLIVRLDER